jgi:hypothetical protein
MPRGKSSYDQNMLTMALVGYEVEKKKIEERIQEIRARLGGSKLSGRAGAAEADEAPTRRKLSKAARRRIAAAQKKRWAEHRKANPKASKGK